MSTVFFCFAIIKGEIHPKTTVSTGKIPYIFRYFPCVLFSIMVKIFESRAAPTMTCCDTTGSGVSELFLGLPVTSPSPHFPTVHHKRM